MAFDAFISHSSLDKAAAQAACAALEAAGIDCWIAPRDITPGTDWSAAIVHALDHCRVFVLIFSKNANKSPQIRREIQRAAGRGVSIVPVRIENIEPTEGIAYFMEAVHWLDACSPPLAQHLPHLVDAVQANMSATPAPLARPAIPVEELGSEDAPLSASSDAPGIGPGAAGMPGMLRDEAPVAAKSAVGRWIAILGSAAALIVLVIGAAIWFMATPAVVPHVPAGGIVSITDCGECPELVVIPTGSFTMGSPESEPQRNSDEGPQRQITISKAFAVGRYTVTFDQWDLCVAEKACNGPPDDAGWGRGRQPVINVSWDDAHGFTEWLSKKTGKAYRLLTEAEREYVARAGTTTPFWWGSRITTKQANFNGTFTYTGEEKGIQRDRTLPVDAFDANPWGLYQVAGNIWEWVEDCYHDSYDGAPTNGSAWLTGDCSRRSLRGGSWGSQPRNLRSAARYKGLTDLRDRYYGFRVARER